MPSRVEQFPTHPRVSMALRGFVVLAGVAFFALIILSADARRPEALLAMLLFSILSVAIIVLTRAKPLMLAREISERLARPELKLGTYRPTTKSSKGTPPLEQALRASLELAERYELLTTNIAASVVIFDRDRRVLFCSPFTEVLTGYHAEAIYSHPGDFWGEIVVESERDKYDKAWSFAQLGEDYSVRYQVHHHDDIKLWFDTQFVPLCDDGGNIVSVMCVTVDVSELVNQRKQVEEQNRDLTDFTYMVSHDLKAPVFTIKGMASALLEDYGQSLGKDGHALIQHILAGATRLEKLIASVIEYSSLGRKEARDVPVDLGVVLGSVLEDLAEQIRQTEAQVLIESKLPTVRGDDVRYYQLFSNLIGNAMKYRAPGRRPQIHVRAQSAGKDMAALEVTDNGLGIPAAKLEDIFRPYHRAHGSEIEGSGIGLASVKKIVEKVGGAVSVKSIEGEGSTFRVTLPLPPPKPQSIPENLRRYFEGDR